MIEFNWITISMIFIGTGMFLYFINKGLTMECVWYVKVLYILGSFIYLLTFVVGLMLILYLLTGQIEVFKEL